MKKLNIDFNNWIDIPISTNEQQIKELYPLFYDFLIKENLLKIYLKMFDKWKNDKDTFKEIMNYYENKNNFLLKPINTLNFNYFQ